MTTNTVDIRIAALRRFAAAITLLTIFGHAFLGFEQAYAYVLVALATAYGMELLLEAIEAWSQNRPTRFSGSAVDLMNFLLPAHITGLACAMLLYSSDRLWPIAFAVAVATGSKYVFRVRVGNGVRHFFNPSNAGISVTLMIFPWVGIAPPYHFTENLTGIADLLLPMLFIVVGTFLNARFTGKLPLIGAWLGGFALQALLRSWYFDTPVLAALDPMTGVAFLLFTFYMVTDPGTTPFKTKSQIAFGASVAMMYGLLMTLHVVFGLFFALLAVCLVRGAYLWSVSFPAELRSRKLPQVLVATRKAT